MTKRDIDTDFVALGHDNAAWNVVRSEFDHLLLEHAASLGAKVYENTKVISLEFDENEKPVSAKYVHRSSSDTLEGVIAFGYLVDATGRAGLMSTKYLKNRRFTESLKNIATWGYWAGTGTYGEGTARAGAPWFEALTGIDCSETQISCPLIQRKLLRRIWVGVVHTFAHRSDIRWSRCQQEYTHSLWEIR